MKRREILDHAIRCVCEERNKDYKEPEDNFHNIAKYWNEYLWQKYGFTGVDSKDIGILMALLKIARMAGADIDDNNIDACGYLACAGEIANKEYLKSANDKLNDLMNSINGDLHKIKPMEKEEISPIMEDALKEAEDFKKYNYPKSYRTGAFNDIEKKDDVEATLEYIASMGNF